MVTMQDYAGLKPTWCPGCGNFGILQAIETALVELSVKPHQVLLVSGIGQAGKLPHYTKANVFNALHGRALPVAIGAKCANPDLIVLTIGGDGDGYAEGGNHLLHAMRRNHDVTYLVHDNQVYGLTKGQASPTSDEGFVTKSTPRGAGMPINPIGFAILGGASFVARGFAGDVAHLSSIIKKGIRHKGFSLIDILQPCVSFNHRNTFEWYRERIYKMEDEHGYDVANRKGALEKAEEWEQRIPIGILYRVERDSFEEKQPALSGIPPVKQEIIPVKVKELLANHR